MVRSDRPWENGLPVAAPSWQLAARLYTPAGEPLGRTGHVLAVPPGENGLLIRLERFLAGEEEAVRGRLAAEAAEAQEAAREAHWRIHDVVATAVPRLQRDEPERD